MPATDRIPATLRTAARPWHRPTPWVVSLAAVILVACGGGGSDDAGRADAQAGGSGLLASAYAAGPITGFGSVIVNGVRYDDSAAQVLDDDGGVSGRDRLKLGWMVEVEASAVDRAAGTARAHRIRHGSELTGPVGTVDVAAGTLTVLGQTVVLGPTTVFDDRLAGGLAALRPGDVVEIHARLDAATGRYLATRVEPQSGATAWRLRGAIANLDTAARTFTIGGATIVYAGVAAVPPGLANGSVVGVLLSASPVDGRWQAVALRPVARSLGAMSSAHVRGAVTAFTSAAAFTVNGVAVDASTAQFPDGQDGLRLGAQVEVEGAGVDGVLVARKVELEDRHAGEDRHRFELHGPVGGLDTATRSFVLRGVTVTYGDATRWDRITAADLANGLRVEVRGVPSADRTRLTASRIKKDD